MDAKGQSFRLAPVDLIFGTKDILFVCFLSFFPFFFFKAAPLAYGDSQARGPIGAAASGLRQSSAHLFQMP